MSDRPILGHRVAEGDRQEQWEDYALALRTIRAARGVFLIILAFSLLINIGAYSAARWGGILDPREAGQETISPAGEYDSRNPESESVRTYSGLYYATRVLMPLAEFLGPISCALLALCFLLAANVCLSGGLGGARGSISAFFWMLVLLALLFPWSRWLADSTGMLQVPGVYLTFDELRTIPTSFSNRTHEILHYVRFLGYPVLALCILLVGDARFARGYRLVQRHLGTRLTGRV